jgi:hypothetical protein
MNGLVTMDSPGAPSFSLGKAIRLRTKLGQDQIGYGKDRHNRHKRHKRRKDGGWL